MHPVAFKSIGQNPRNIMYIADFKSKKYHEVCIQSKIERIYPQVGNAVTFCQHDNGLQ